MPVLNAQVAEKARKNDEAYPGGTYYLEVVGFDGNPATARSKPKDGKPGKYMPWVEFKILQPAEFAGRKIPRKEYFVLGTDDDPDFENPETVGPGLSRFKRLCDAAGVACEGEVSDVLAEIQTVGVVLNRTVQADKNRDGTPNEYAGRVQNEIKSFFAVGDRAAEIFPDTTGGTASEAVSKVAGLKKAAASKPAAGKGFGVKK